VATGFPGVASVESLPVSRREQLKPGPFVPWFKCPGAAQATRVRERQQR
jgi:hypothetical protein